MFSEIVLNKVSNPIRMQDNNAEKIATTQSDEFHKKNSELLKQYY